MVNDEKLCSIRQIADFIIKNKIDTLFDDALTVRKWLDIDCIAFGKCPECGKEAVEIHGEGITSDNRHYPMENCLYCRFTPVDFKKYSGTAGKIERDKETKAWLINTLESWDSTFDEGEETEIPAYIDKLRKDEVMTPDEYEEILFHLWQKFYDVE